MATTNQTPPTTPPTPGPSPAGAALAGLAGLLGSQFIPGGSSNIPPELRQLLAQSLARQQATNPLFSAAASGLYQMLPTFARQGGAQFAVNAAPIAADPAGGGLPSWLLPLLTAIGGGALAKSGLPSVAANALNNLFRRKPSTGPTYGPINPGPDYGPWDLGIPESNNPFNVGALDPSLFPGWSTFPTGQVDTGTFFDWPERGGPGADTNQIDPSQFPGWSVPDGWGGGGGSQGFEPYPDEG